MAASVTSIANAALRIIGAKRINSIDDDTKPARILKDAYEDVRKDLLREMKPRFANVRVELSANATAPVWEYDNAFDLPTGCLRVVDVKNDSRVVWVVEGRQILTDLDAPLQVLYTDDVEDAETMDPKFRQALAAKLAEECAESITGTMSEVEKAAAIADRRVRKAGAADGQEATPANLLGSEWLDARWTGSRLDRVPSDDGTPL